MPSDGVPKAGHRRVLNPEPYPFSVNPEIFEVSGLRLLVQFKGFLVGVRAS